MLFEELLNKRQDPSNGKIYIQFSLEVGECQVP